MQFGIQTIKKTKNSRLGYSMCGNQKSLLIHSWDHNELWFGYGFTHSFCPFFVITNNIFCWHMGGAIAQISHDKSLALNWNIVFYGIVQCVSYLHTTISTPRSIKWLLSQSFLPALLHPWQSTPCVSSPWSSSN